MWQRFVRALKALFGGAVEAIEDPKLILEQNIRELNDQVPKMNESIATVKAGVVLAEKELSKAQAEYNDIVSKMKAAIQAGRDDIAAGYATRMQSLKGEIAKIEGQLAHSRKAYDQAIELKKAFMREKDRKIAEAKEALRAHERSKWQAKIADTMQQFEVGGIDQTHDEMVRKINERTAKNEAKAEMALDSVDTTTIRLEQDAEKIRAMELVKQFKMEMGMTEASSTGSTTTENLEEVQNQNKNSVL